MERDLRGTGVLLSLALVLAAPAVAVRADMLSTSTTEAATTSYCLRGWAATCAPDLDSRLSEWPESSAAEAGTG